MDPDKANSDNQIVHLRNKLLTLDALAKKRPTKSLIDGLLYRDTLAQLSGGPGSYKTFLAITMACCLVAGVPFVNMRVPKQATVVYVAAEGANDMYKRILAWCEAWEVSPDAIHDRLYVLPLPIQLGVQMDVAQIIDIVREVQADLLVLDTRARCTFGMDENSATTQGVAIEAADGIRRAADCTVLAVHHTPRNGSAGRGSNAWDGAVWSELRVDGGGLQVKIHCEKHKDVSSGCDHHFALRPHIVSKTLMPHTLLDAERETLVISNTAPGMATLSAQSRQVVLEIIWNSAPPDGFTGPQVVNLAKEAGVGQSSAYTALKWAVDQEFVRNVGTKKRGKYVTGERRP